jgi:Primase C terminal 1 (PriCT-1)
MAITTSPGARAHGDVWQSSGPSNNAGGSRMTAQISALKPEFRVPDDLTELDQWVLWRGEKRNGQRTKVPYQVNGKRADTTDPRTWATFEKALGAWRRNSKRYAGIGFVFSKEDNLVGIDLDDCLDEQGDLKDWARGIVERFSDTYMEISPSGSGLKMWACGSLPSNLGGVKVGDGQVEMYNHSHYFTVTGRAFCGAPLQVEDHSDDLLALYGRLTPGRKTWKLQPLPDGQIPYGRQHNTLVSLCGTLRVRGVCEEAIEACLQVMNEKQCEKPGPRRNVTRLVRSSRKWGRR